MQNERNDIEQVYYYQILNTTEKADMTLGTINHLSLTVSDRSKSEPFYDQILQFMGYQQVERDEKFTMWWLENAGAFLIYAQTCGFS